MKALAVSIILSLGLSIAASSLAQKPQPLTIDDILKLHAAKLSDSVIIAHATASGLNHALTTAEILQLKQAGLSDSLIEFLINHAGKPGLTAAESSANPPTTNQQAPAQKTGLQPDPLTPAEQQLQCDYLKRLDEITNRYEQQGQTTLDTIKLSLDPAAIDLLRANRQLQLKEISQLTAPTSLTDFHEQVCRFMIDEIEVYKNLGLALAGDSTAAVTIKDAAVTLLGRGKPLYERHNTLRKQCKMPELPSLFSLGL